MPVYMRTFYLRKLQKLFDSQTKEHEKAMRQAKTRSRGVPKRSMPRFR